MHFCLQEVVFQKQANEKLGISIRGGSKGSKGNPLDADDEGIFISKVSIFYLLSIVVGFFSMCGLPTYTTNLHKHTHRSQVVVLPSETVVSKLVTGFWR